MKTRKLLDAVVIAASIIAIVTLTFVMGDAAIRHQEAESQTADPQPAQTPAVLALNEPQATIEPEVNEQPAEPVKPAQEPEKAPEWTSLGSYILTAYCSCEKCCGYWATIRPLDDQGHPIVYTSTGAVAQEGTTIAVDPKVIPYGSKVKINDHIYIAQDTGGAIKGKRIDVYHADHKAALVFGRQEAEVYVLQEQ